MKKNLKANILLSILSALLLSAGFMIPHAGGFALVALIPLLWMDSMEENQGKRFFFWHYLTFVLWNAITTFWVCNATVGGGIFAITANALQMSVIWSIYRLFKKHSAQGTVLPYIFLAAMWIAWERAYFSAEVSWPWLILGNSFASSTTSIQWYEYTGVLGGSLWVWVCNLGIFALLKSLTGGSWTKLRIRQKAAAITGLSAVVFLPLLTSWIIYASLKPVNEGELRCAVLQPNLDPYEKFESLSQDEQNEILVSLAAPCLGSTTDSTSQDSNAQSSVDLLIAPETFCHDVIIERRQAQSPTALYFQMLLENFPGTDLLMGATSYEMIPSSTAPSYTARSYRPGIWMEEHNSAMMLSTASAPQIYHKDKLVVGVEKMPWPRVMSKVDEKLGGVMGRCVGQKEVSLLTTAKGVKTGCAICYESVYPEHFASFVRKGAQVMTIITNDAWWGDTPGYRQHLNYARLRAIETRRDIARCANTGISAYINQRGDVISSTQWWKRTSLCGTVHLSSRQTVFTQYGDITGRVCTFIFLLLAALMITRIIPGLRHSRNSSDPLR